MGYYAQAPTNKGKAEYIANTHGGRIVNETEAKAAMDAGEGVIVVMDNGMFEAAGFAYSPAEFTEFTRGSRPRKFVVLPLAKAKEISDYNR